MGASLKLGCVIKSQSTDSPLARFTHARYIPTEFESLDNQIANGGITMNRRVIILSICVVLIGALAMATDPEPWFDLQNCAFCKQIGAQPGLAEQFNHEYHMLHNGVMSITHVGKEYKDAFAKAQLGMKDVIKEMQAGKEVKMCRHCSTLGSFYQLGVMPDQITRGEDIIVVYTSADTATVRKLQEFGKNSADAVAAMAKEKSGK